MIEEATKTRMTTGLFSSRTEEWETPQIVFDKLNDEFHFTLDACATKENAKCVRYFTKEQNGLEQEWGGVIYMNPPYGKTIPLWMKKALNASKSGATVVCLVHSRTDTKWFHEYAMQAEEIRFVKGRLKFGDGKQSAPFPSFVVIFRNANTGSPIIKTVQYK